jgi:hypothetical protein
LKLAAISPENTLDKSRAPKKTAIAFFMSASTVTLYGFQRNLTAARRIISQTAVLRPPREKPITAAKARIT